MSAASDRGKRFEQRIARLMRSKGFKVQRDRRSGAGDTNRMDISDFSGSCKLAIEAKSQVTLNIKAWTRQAAAAASMGQIPTVVYEDQELVQAVTPFNDLLDLVAENKQLRAQLDELRNPAATMHVEQLPGLSKAVTKKVQAAGPTCRYGHLADSWGYCQQKRCPGARTYKQPKKARS